MIKEVKKINREQTKDFILNIHYAHRMPSISYAFGLYEEDKLIGICTYGKPASPSLCNGVCGKENSSKVWELNRLVLKNNNKNEASFFISKTLKMLPRPLIIVSYADSSQNHKGIVYRASNFIFTGKTKPRTDMAGEEGKHSRHHLGDRSKRIFRSAKYRYIYFIGNKKEVKKLKESLRYPQLSTNNLNEEII